MQPKLKEQAAKRLARIEGQVRGIARMVDRDEYCIDVLTQLNSVAAAIDGIRVLVLDGHVRSCVAGALRDGGGGDELDELSHVFKRFARG